MNDQLLTTASKEALKILSDQVDENVDEHIFKRKIKFYNITAYLHNVEAIAVCIAVFILISFMNYSSQFTGQTQEKPSYQPLSGCIFKNTNDVFFNGNIELTVLCDKALINNLSITIDSDEDISLFKATKSETSDTKITLNMKYDVSKCKNTDVVNSFHIIVSDSEKSQIIASKTVYYKYSSNECIISLVNAGDLERIYLEYQNLQSYH